MALSCNPSYSIVGGKILGKAVRHQLEKPGFESRDEFSGVVGLDKGSVFQ